MLPFLVIPCLVIPCLVIQSQLKKIKQVAHQLKSGKNATDIKISKLLDLKHLHTSWTVDLHNHIHGEKEIIIKRFIEVGVIEVFNDARGIYERVENLFRS